MSVAIHLRSVRRVLAAVGFVCLILVLNSMGVTRSLDNAITAQFFSLSERPASGEIVLVDIDAKSLAEIGEWPWQRNIHAELIERLADAGAADIVLDIDFSTRSTVEADDRLAEAIEAAGGVVLAAFAQPSDANASSILVNKPIDQFDAFAWPAIVNVRTDGDGRVRSMPFGLMLEGEPLQSVASLLARSDAGIEGEFKIDFGILSETFPRLSVSDVLNGEPLDIVQGRQVLIGANARELRDFFLVPNQGVIAGHELQAIAAETLLQGRVLSPSSKLLEFTVISFVAALGLCLVFFLHFRMTVAGLVGLSLILFGAAYYLHINHAFSLTIGGALLSILALSIWKIARELDVGSVLLAVWRGRASNQQLLLDSVIENHVEGVLIMSDEGRVIKESHAAKTILRSKHDLKDASLIDVHPQLGRLVDFVAEKAAKGESISKDLLIFESFDERGERLVIEAVATPSHLVNTDAETGQHQDSSLVVSLIFREITARKVAEEKLSFLARHHEKTGLLARQGLLEAIDENRMTAPTAAAEITACFRLEGLEQFESSLGYDLAVHLVKAVGKRFAKIAPKGALTAALEDRVFVLVFSSEDGLDFVSRQLGDFAALMSEPYNIGSHSGVLAASCGFYVRQSADISAETSLKNANSAMNQASAVGAKSLAYSEDIKRTIVARQALETDLRRAIRENQFSLRYHPIVDLRTGRIDTAEALIRWNHPQGHVISPATFIPVAEEAGLMEHIGKLVLRLVCRDLRQLPNNLKMAVNISPAHFLSETFVADVTQIISRHALSPSRFDLELTETIAAADINALSQKLSLLKKAGFSLSLDDFGTGYSSLSYLRTLQVDKLKIDMEFAKDLGTVPAAEGVVRAITSIAEELRMRTVLEGIETREQAMLARKCGVTYGQGYLFSRPLSAQRLFTVLESFNKAA